MTMQCPPHGRHWYTKDGVKQDTCVRCGFKRQPRRWTLEGKRKCEGGTNAPRANSLRQTPWHSPTAACPSCGKRVTCYSRKVDGGKRREWRLLTHYVKEEV